MSNRITLNAAQAQFLRDRAAVQTERVKGILAPVVMTDLVTVALRFYQECPDLVEHYLDWAAKDREAIWPPRSR